MGFIICQELLVATLHAHDAPAVAREEVQLLYGAAGNILVRNNHGFNNQAFVHEWSLRLAFAQHLGEFTGLSLGDHHA